MSKYRNQVIFGLLLAIVLYIGTFLFFDSQNQLSAAEGILELTLAFPLELVLVLIVIQLCVILLRFVEWHYYLGVISARHLISVKDSFVIFTACFTMVVSPGKAAEVLKAVFLKAKTGVPIARGASVVLAERIVDGLAVIFILTVTLILAGDQLELGSAGGVNYDMLSRTIIFSSAFALAAGLVAVQISPLAYFILGIIKRLPVISRAHDALREFYESSRDVFKLQHVVPMTLIGGGIYALSSLGFYIVLVGYGLDASWTLFFQSMFITGIVSAIGALSFIPNGAGITEVSTVGMLLALVAPTTTILTPAVAGAASLVQGFFHKWFRVVVGLMVMIIFRNDLFTRDFQQALMVFEADELARKDRSTGDQPKVTQAR